MTTRYLLGVLILFICIWSEAEAQDVEENYKTFKERLSEDPLRVSGSFSAMGQFYHSMGIDNRAQPFSGRLLGALNFDLLGIKVPLSLAISNGGVVFNRRLPSYNFVGISPSYKWAKLLVGTRSLNLGKYSFSNHSFSGAGFELTPAKWNFSAFYGRLRRARIDDFHGITSVDHYFRRLGFGGKVGYVDGKDKVLLAVFKAWDDGSSIPLPASSFNFTPSENVIVSTEVGKSLGQKMDLEIIFANSGYTADRATTSRQEVASVYNYGGLLNSNLSTRFRNAFEAKLNYRLKSLNLSLGYERIDPGYQTMGALFFNNDVENITGGVRVKMLKRKLVLNARFGMQKNNLQNDQTNDYRRLVGSINANLNASERLTLSGSFSNFNNVNRRTTLLSPNSPLLSTTLVLNSQQANISANYMISNDNTRTSMLMLVGNYAHGSNIENDAVITDQKTTSVNSFLYYNLEYKPSGWSFGANTGYNQNSFGSLENIFLNFGVMGAKKLWENRIDLGFQATITRSSQTQDRADSTDGKLYSFLFTSSFVVTPSSAITLNSGYLHNNVDNQSSGLQSFSEFRNTLHFHYRFNPGKN